MIRRREFITLLGGAAAWPLWARAQQRAFPVIGLLSSRSPDIDTPLISVIRQALNEKGLVEGQNVALDYRWAEGQYDRLAGLAADLVRQQVTVIVSMGGDLPALAAKATTAVLVNPENIPRADAQVSDLQTAARSVGQEITILNARTIRDIDAAFAT